MEKRIESDVHEYPSTSKAKMHDTAKRIKSNDPSQDGQTDWEALEHNSRKRKNLPPYKQNFVKAQEDEEDENELRPKARIRPKLLETKGVEDWDPRARELMLKTGFIPGKGLGSKGTGIENPVDAGRESDGRGLGFQKRYEQEHFDYHFEEEKTEEKDVKWIPKETHVDIVVLMEVVLGERKTIIDDETYFCDESILREMLRLKSLLDDMKPMELVRARSRSNPYETIKKGIFINRAAMKMANIDSILDFEFTKLNIYNNDNFIHQELLYFADVCAGPGGFTEYVLYRKKWLAKGFGFTLKGDCDFKLGTFKVASPESFETIYGPKDDSDGDIYNPENVNYFVNHVIQNTDGIGVHFMMADGGFSVEGNENIQEILSHQIYLSQCLVALSIVRTGGHFICKFFDIFTPFSVGLIYLFNICFEKVAVHKPVTSRPANSERYLYCMHKINSKTVQAVLEYLQNCHQKMWQCGSSKGSPSNTTVTELVNLHVLTDSATEFFQYIYHSNNEFGRDQIEGLKKIITFHKDRDRKETRQEETRKKFLQAWHMDVIPKHVGDLTENLFIDGLAKSQDTLLTKANMKDVVKSPYFWMCTPIECPESKAYRTFYKSCGRSSVFKYEGGHRNRWASIGDMSISFEMPKNTLVYGEIVFGKKSRAAFYIIDGYMLGGIPIHDENFDTRIKLCEKFSKAISKTRNDKGFSLAAVKVKKFEKLGKEYFPRLISKMQFGKDSKIQDVYCPVDLDEESPLYQTSGLLFLKITKEPWIKHWSRSQNREYYYNTLNRSSDFEVPLGADANFYHSITNRMVWYWNKKLLTNSDVNPSSQLDYFTLLQYLKSL